MKTAMSKIAEFDGLEVYINTRGEIGRLPHVHVKSADGDVEILLEAGAPIREAQLRGNHVPVRVKRRIQSKLADWFELTLNTFDSTVESVLDRCREEWAAMERGEAPEVVPTPQEIAEANAFVIDSAKPLPDQQLEVTFRNGDVKIVDIRALAGNKIQLTEDQFKNFRNLNSLIDFPMRPDGTGISFDAEYLREKGVDRDSESGVSKAAVRLPTT